MVVMVMVTVMVMAMVMAMAVSPWSAPFRFAVYEDDRQCQQH